MFLIFGFIKEEISFEDLKTDDCYFRFSLLFSVSCIFFYPSFGLGAYRTGSACK